MTRLALALALVPLLLLGAACRTPTPEEAVRRVLDEGVAAIHARDAARAAKLLSPAYRDRRGRTRTDLTQLAYFALRRGPVWILLRDTKVSVDGDAAKVETTAYAVQGRAEIKAVRDLVPRDADRMELTLTLAREDGAWRVRAIDGDPAVMPGE